MQAERFKALLLETAGAPELRELDRHALPEGDVLVQVAYSSLNYKDGLAVTGKGKVLRSYPIVPGIDLAGTVVESSAGAFQPGDKVLVTGWGLGEEYWGGYAELARVRSEWLLPLPAGLDEKQAMALGTAGLTAALAVQALGERGLHTDTRPVLVTGASGGVGSLAVALLARRGLRVTASTGRGPDYPRMLGAQEVIDRSELGPSPKPLESERWSGAIDTVGGATLAAVLRGLARGAGVAVCGNAGGAQLETTVFPFILRGVAMLGIDSVRCPADVRRAAWERLALELEPELLEQIAEVVPLEDVPARAESILRGEVRGRIVVDVRA